MRLDVLQPINSDSAHRADAGRLLMEKVDLQSAGINQRELALQRERDFG